jgi:hypothetical protein
MTKWIEWIEPFVDSEPVYLRVSPETAILSMKKSTASIGFTYKSDQDALDDFIIGHWAKIIELP